MRLLKHLPLLTVGLLAASHAVQAKVLSPRALVKNCDQVTRDLTELKNMLSNANSTTIDMDYVDRMTVAHANAERSQLKLQRDMDDSAGPNMLAGLKSLIAGDGKALKEQEKQARLLNNCALKNKKLVDDSERILQDLNAPFSQISGETAPAQAVKKPAASQSHAKKASSTERVRQEQAETDKPLPRVEL